MFRGGRKYGRGSTSNRGDFTRGKEAGPNAPRPRGLFADGIWHCDCSPRLPTEHFKVKKESPNQGRWFYTCQKQENKRCGFFLWDEDAKPREEAAVMSNGRTEPVGERVVIDAQGGWRAGKETAVPTSAQTSTATMAQLSPGRGPFAQRDTRQDDETTLSPSPPHAPLAKPTNGVKRNAQDAGIDDDDDDDSFPWPLTGLEETEFAEAADLTAMRTPRKAQKTGVYATPVTTTKRTLPWLKEEPAIPFDQPTSAHFTDTPSKAPNALPAATSSHVPASFPRAATPGAPQTLATAKLPSPPSRFRDALSDAADSGGSLTSEALAALSSIDIPPDIRAKLRSVLTKHDLRAQGVAKGRDIARLAVRAKEAKIVELQYRIASLEAEREVDRGVNKKLRWEAEHG